MKLLNCRHEKAYVILISYYFNISSQKTIIEATYSKIYILILQYIICLISYIHMSKIVYYGTDS